MRSKSEGFQPSTAAMERITASLPPAWVASSRRIAASSEAGEWSSMHSMQAPLIMPPIRQSRPPTQNMAAVTRILSPVSTLAGIR